jgi:hypothetical protein
MLINEQRYCNLCHGVIVMGQKHVQVRMRGNSQYDANHYHYRFAGDCWERQRSSASRSVRMPSVGGASEAAPEHA